MPSPSTAKIPPPKSPDEFEEICLDAARLRWRPGEFHRNGRQGQAQAGVDVYGHDAEGRHIGVQCKNTEGLDEAVVRSETTKAEAFDPGLDAFYVATTGPRDATLQTAVRKLSEERKARGAFTVAVLFWDDIVGVLDLDRQVLLKHYPFLADAGGREREHDVRLLEALKAALPPGDVQWMGTFDFGGHFENDPIERLRAFHDEAAAPSGEFASEALEAARQELIAAARVFSRDIALNTSPMNAPGWFCMSRELRRDNPARFRELQERLNERADAVVAAYRLIFDVARAERIF